MSSPSFPRRWAFLLLIFASSFYLKTFFRSSSATSSSSFRRLGESSPLASSSTSYSLGLHSAPGQYSFVRRWLGTRTTSASSYSSSAVPNGARALQEQQGKNEIEGLSVFTAVGSNETELYGACNFSIDFRADDFDAAIVLGETEAQEDDEIVISDYEDGEDLTVDEQVALKLEEDKLILVNFTNGTYACEEYKEEMTWWEIVLWLALLLYLFLALYIICDHHFVPALEVVGNALRWSESVQGATLLAVGSSFPEFVTALVGVIFFPEDNPGPSTNIGSAVFNSCIIIGVSLIFLPRRKDGWKLAPKPFFRDAVYFAVAATATFIVYETWTPKQLYWYECLMLSLLYVLYVVILISTDKCISPPVSEEERMFIEAATAAAVVGSRASMVVFRRFEAPDQKLSFRHSMHWDKHDSRGVISFESETPRSAARRQEKQRSKSWAPGSTNARTIPNEVGMVEIELSDSATSTPAQTPRRGLQTPTHSTHEVGSSDIVEQAPHSEDGHGHKKKKTCCGWVYTVISWPISIALKITIPQPRRMGKCPAGCMTAIACFMSIVWLGFVTYFVVEIASDVFLDLGLGSEFLGLTILAVGSSLPDCLSSIIVARQGRIDMAVCNALGSNIFDFLWCIGFPFLVQSLMEQQPTFVPVDDSFLYLLIACFVSAGLIMAIIAVGCMRATPWHGGLLILAYCGFITGYIFMFGISK